MENSKEYYRISEAKLDDKEIFVGYQYEGERPENIGTEDAPLIVTDGNYVFEDSHGSKFVVAQVDIGVEYAEVKN